MITYLDPRVSRPWTARWDHGITWYTRRTVEPADLPFDVNYVQDKVLRAADLTSEYEFVRSCIVAATQAAEDDTQRALMPQTWEQVLSGFPSSGRIELERPPLIEVVSLSYYDSDDTVQQLAVSPAEFRTVTSGKYQRAAICPVDGEAWPSSVSTRPDAVTVTFRAGFEDPTDGEFALISTGIALMVGELYKQRTLSVHVTHNTPSALKLERFWRQVK